MRPGLAASLAVLVLPLLGACGSSEPATIERLRAAMADYAAGKPEPTEERIAALFAQVDADVAALRAEAAAMEGTARTEAESRARALQEERLALWQAYVKAKVDRLRGAAEDTVRDLGKQLGQGIEEAGRAIRESMEKPTGDTVPR
jgi:hypothetical protein